jgi:hypothetical protein
MTIRSTRDAERVLADLDPAADLPHRPDPAVLRTVLAAPRDLPRSPVRPRRRLVLAGATLVVVAATVTAAGLLRADPDPVYATTPVQLRYERQANAPAAGDLLRDLATAAERSTTRGSGDYGYIHTKDWLLANPNLADREQELSVDPSEKQLWYAADGSARIVITRRDSPNGPPTEHDAVLAPGRHKGYVCWADGSTPPPTCPVDRLLDSAVLRDVLLISDRYQGVNQTGRQSPLSATAHLSHNLVLPPAVRAQLWRVLADLPGISYTGRVTDRAGRSGEAFSLDFDAETGPVRDTLIIDPANGELLGYERTLLALTNPDYFAPMVPGGSAPLRIRTPAVVDYSVFLAAEHRPSAR